MSQPLSQLTDEERLTAGLDPLTRRNLILLPPQDQEVMQQVGISKTNLDGPVRVWINDSFRQPKKMPKLPRGSIKPTTTWKQLVSML